MLNLGVYDGILRVEWLTENKATLKSRDGIFTFLDSQGQKAKVIGSHGKSKL